MNRVIILDRKIDTLHWVFALIVLAFACSHNSKPDLSRLTKKQLQQEELNHQCKRIHDFEVNNRASHYPYKDASEVWIISFDNKEEDAFTHSIPVHEGKVDLTRVKEWKVLSNIQVDSLTDILFNHGFSGHILTQEGVGCYNPRNGILFFNSSRNLFEYLEICFECYGFSASSEKITIGEKCSEKYDLIKSFFAKSGIAIGTTKEIRVLR